MSYHCARCKGTNVQHAMWVNPNTDEVFDEFGSWCAGDNSWCEDCEAHTDLVGTDNAPALTEEQIRVLRIFAEDEEGFRLSNASATDLADACKAALAALGK